jgi:hypothetical protein
LTGRKIPEKNDTNRYYMTLSIPIEEAGIKEPELPED